MTQSWVNDKYVKNWFELLGNERTIANYRNEFPIFLEYVKAQTEFKTPSEFIDSRLQHLTTTDLKKRRYWEMQVVKFKNHLQSRNLRMATIKGYIRTVQSFFSKNGVKLQFSRGELKIEPSEKDKVFKEWIPSNEEVRLLYRMANNARDRAILLTLYQSGFSEVDVASMKIEDFSFYDDNGNWKLPINEDLFHQRRREKTNIWQKTCLNREALEETRIMLQSRGFPKEGYLFVSFRNQALGVRGINEAIKAIVEKAFNGRAKEWMTKHLRDAFMNALLQARIPQEVKDSMVGHKREGAREDYALTEQTVKASYDEAFKFLTINGYGSQSRKIEEIDKETKELKAQIYDLAKTVEGFQNALTRQEKNMYKLLQDSGKIPKSKEPET
jgi:site-specific recombinase XerD